MDVSSKTGPVDRFLNKARQWFGDSPTAEEQDREHFLPNFCEGKMILSVLAIAEMLALVISLVMPVPSIFFDNYFQALLQISAFVLWIAFACAMGLCLARNYLRTLPDKLALITAYLLLLLVTLMVNEGAVWFLWLTGKIATPRPDWYAHMHMQNLSVSAIINALMLGYFLTKQELKQRTVSEAKAKIQALQSRIRPHFVFNAMNIIASLTRTEPEKAETAIEDMSELFRMMLNENETLVPVRKEVEVAQKYLALEQLRLDNRLQVFWDIGKFPRKAIMPILTLQPLLEHAITTGIEPSASGGSVSVSLWEDQDTIFIKMSNTLPKRRGRTISEQNDTLENVRQRFQSHYGDKASLEAHEEDGQFIVSMTLPVRDSDI